MKKFKIEKIAIFSKHELKADKNFLDDLINFLKSKKKEVFIDDNTGKFVNYIKPYNRAVLAAKVDLVITLGGDGTLLSSSHSIQNKNVLFLGINFGNLGFLAEIKDTKALYEDLEKIFNGNYFIDERSMLRITVYRNGKKLESFLGLNDAVINQGNLARIIKLKVDIGRRKVAEFKADGLVISSPTGSTAHSLSAGGPIVHPSLDAFLMTPICPLTLSSRPILLPNDEAIHIFIETEKSKFESNIALTVDGQMHYVLEYGDRISIRRSSKKLNLVRMQKESYYKSLRSKIGWAV